MQLTEPRKMVGGDLLGLLDGRSQTCFKRGRKQTEQQAVSTAARQTLHRSHGTVRFRKQATMCVTLTDVPHASLYWVPPPVLGSPPVLGPPPMTASLQTIHLLTFTDV